MEQSCEAGRHVWVLRESEGLRTRRRGGRFPREEGGDHRKRFRLAWERPRRAAAWAYSEDKQHVHNVAGPLQKQYIGYCDATPVLTVKYTCVARSYVAGELGKGLLAGWVVILYLSSLMKRSGSLKALTRAAQVQTLISLLKVDVFYISNSSIKVGTVIAKNQFWGCRYHPTEVVITENGVDVPQEDTLSYPEVLDDHFRVDFYKSYLEEVVKAVTDDKVRPACSPPPFPPALPKLAVFMVTG